MTINCRGTLVDLCSPKVMGILNVTPDSFFDGNKYKNDSEILLQTEKMLEEGATFIDVGAYSSRPGAQFVTPEEEKRRLMPAIQSIKKTFPKAIVSVDTFRANIAIEALEAGATVINDISGGCAQPDILKVAAKYRAPYILMHMKGTPENKEDYTDYIDMKKDILTYFSKNISLARDTGINDIIIDPGFGFSKTLEQNYELVKHFDMFHEFFEIPVLIGISRKSMIFKLFNTTTQNALNGTTILNTILAQKKANILRVHDVKEAVEVVKIIETFT